MGDTIINKDLCIIRTQSLGLDRKNHLNNLSKRGCFLLCDIIFYINFYFFNFKNMEKSPKTNKSPEKKSEVNPDKLNAAQTAMKWLKENWRKSTILGVGAMMAAPGMAKSEANINAQADQQFFNDGKNKKEIQDLRNREPGSLNKNKNRTTTTYKAEAKDFKKVVEEQNEEEIQEESDLEQIEVDPSWPSLDPDLVEEYGLHYSEIGVVLNRDGSVYKGEYGVPFLGGAKEQEIKRPQVKNQQNITQKTNKTRKMSTPSNRPKLKPGFKFGPDGVIVDSVGNPATEDPFVRN